MIRSLILPLSLASLGFTLTACSSFTPGAPTATSASLQVPVREGSPAFAYRQVMDHLTAAQLDHRIIRLVAGQKGMTELPANNQSWRVWLYSAKESKAYIANAVPGQPVSIEAAPAELKAGSAAIDVSRWRVDGEAAQAAARKAGLEAVHGLVLHSAQDLKSVEGLDSTDPAWAVRYNGRFIYINANTGAVL